MADPTITEQAEKWQEIGEQMFTGVVGAWVKSDVSKFITAVIADVFGALVATGVAAMAPIGVGLAKGMALSEDLVAPALAPMAAAGVNDMFGTNIPPSAFERGIIGGNRRDAASVLGAALLNVIKGDNAQLKPDDGPAARYVTFLTNMALEGWYQKWFFETMSSLIPQLDIGKIENWGSLDDKMSEALGLGRLARRVMSPIIDASIVAPLKWQTNKTYRPSLLSEVMAVNEYLAGRWSREQLTEELARQGWDDKRIQAYIAQHQKSVPFDDAMFLSREGKWTLEEVRQLLRDDGYDEIAANDMVTAAVVKRIAAFRDDSLAALKRAYVNRDLTDSEFSTFLHAVVYDDEERSALETAMRTARDMNVKHISLSDVEKAVRVGILSMADYRKAAADEGYDDTSILTMELLLRWDIDKDTSVASHRAQAEAERAAEKKARADAAAARKAQVDAERALHRRGSLATLERAVVRGLIPIARYAEVLAPDYDPDTVQIMTSLVEDQRIAYVDQQERAKVARQRADVRNIDVGALEAAVMSGVLTIDEFRNRLDTLQFAPADADILTATLSARKADSDAAKEKRAQAETAAKTRSINLGQFERLVVRGHRTLADYDQLLASLGFDDASRAAMGELLQIQIDDAAEADAQRQAARQRTTAIGPTLEQMRRGVILGARTESDFQQYLIQNNYTTDAQVVLLADLRADVADAEAARERRQAADAARTTVTAPLATVARAARLGLISPSVYEQRLVADHYAPDDVSIEMTLLTYEIADTQAARQREADRAAAADSKGLSLTQTADGVKAGVLTVDDYQARAIELGYAADAVAALVGVLRAELASLADAKARRDELAQRSGRELSISQLEHAVLGGLMTLDKFSAELVDLGFEPDDAALLAALLSQKLAAAADAKARRGQIATELKVRNLSLSQLEAGVRAGLRSLDQFQSDLQAYGYSADDAALLADLLGQQVDATAAATARRGEIDSELATRHLSLAQLEAAVKDNLKSLDDFYADIQALGYSANDAALLTQLLADKLQSAP